MVFDAIGLDPEVSDNGSADEFLTFRDINHGTPFNGTDEPVEGANEEIDWDDYLFEAVNQLADEAIPTDFMKKPVQSSENMSWYPFKSKEVCQYLYMAWSPSVSRIWPIGLLTKVGCSI
ncbi:hypothetical protein PGTUg99_028914 [Puccinia graminis f. sp. tritici]|uniref:Uncharacterized protein n=1 Tax=Puccinia graminis f. sp. tritici TaxID=56615 RepID=A0A5B0SJY8_PUCGR|nr:hypothetical protein PGTUg99_028914 [Puccinia graminis f. sp. tritici]